MSEIKNASLRQLFIMGAFSTFGKLRQNDNGYPYVTFLNKAGQANNLYFGKKSAERIAMAYGEGDDVSRELATANITQAINATGDQRFKISLKGETQYASAAEMSNIFGVEETLTDFNIQDFKKSFSARVDNTPPTETPEELAARLALEAAGK